MSITSRRGGMAGHRVIAFIQTITMSMTFGLIHLATDACTRHRINTISVDKTIRFVSVVAYKRTFLLAIVPWIIARPVFTTFPTFPDIFSLMPLITLVTLKPSSLITLRPLIPLIPYSPHRYAFTHACTFVTRRGHACNRGKIRARLPRY